MAWRTALPPAVPDDSGKKPICRPLPAPMPVRPSHLQLQPDPGGEQVSQAGRLQTLRDLQRSPSFQRRLQQGLAWEILLTSLKGKKGAQLHLAVWATRFAEG